jgi:hypothetical protein
MSEQAPAPKRKKSQKRQRNKQIHVPCLNEEFNRAASAANASGLSLAAWCRAKIFDGDAGPRAQRRLPVAEENVLRVLALHGKYGNNMNQIAYQLNAHSDFAGAAQYETGLVEWREIRDAMLDLLKLVPDDPPVPEVPNIKSSFLPPGGPSNHPQG